MLTKCPRVESYVNSQHNHDLKEFWITYLEAKGIFVWGKAWPTPIDSAVTLNNSSILERIDLEYLFGFDSHAKSYNVRLCYRVSLQFSTVSTM